MRVDPSGNVGIWTTSPSTLLFVNGAATVTSCSVIAETMQIEGTVEEKQTVCIGSEGGKISMCRENMSLLVVEITTKHAEQILRLGCADSSSKENYMTLGGKDNETWQKVKACFGWYPVALCGVHEFAKAECFRKDDSTLHYYGDRLVTSVKNPGSIRPLLSIEQGGDTVVAKALSLCKKRSRDRRNSYQNQMSRRRKVWGLVLPLRGRCL